jgi:Cu2+-exporting ATPase
MRCGGCSANVKKSLLGHPSVSKASVNLLTGTAAVTTDNKGSEEKARETAQDIAEMIEGKGFKCSIRDGSGGGTSTSEGTSEESDWADFGGLALSAGFLALCCGHHLGHFFHAAGMHQLAGFFGGHGQASLFGNRIVQSVAATAAIFGPGREIVVDGFKSLKNGVPNMNTLVGIGTGAALAVGLSQALGLSATASWEDSSHLLEEPVMLLSVILLGRLLEKRAKRRATRELRALGSLVPQASRLVFDQKGVTRNMEEEATQSLALWNDFDTMSIETNDVRPGDIVKVLPGESIPVDGLILAGESAVDESLLTGESSLVKKLAGSEVIAGTINYDGSLVVRARCSGSECTVKAMKDFVEAAQARDAPVQRLADSICGPFVYTILGLSTATFLFWQGFGYTMFKDALVDYSYASMDSLAWLSSSTSVALRYAVNVLVVACPCALGLATPTSVLVGTSLAANRGVLIRGGDVLESLAKVDTIIVDKTGTITEGWPSVVSTCSDTMSEKELLHLAASLESNASANHPIARAIIDHNEALSAKNLEGDDKKISVEEVEYVTGKGVKGRCNGKMTAVGSLEWILESTVGNGAALMEEEGKHKEASDHTLVYVGIEDSGIVGSLSLVDSIRGDAKEVLERLQERKGIKEVFMLSGDRQPVVNKVAQTVGIKAENALGGLSPFDKSNFIGDLQKKGHSVAMIGDGINDTLALSEARVGIAVTGGMDAASDAADIVLVDESRARRVFSQIEDAMGISQTTFSKIKQNLSWALMYNALSLPLATGALLPTFGLALEPALAGGMMAGSSLTVLLNSLSIYAIHPSAESKRK